MGPFIPGLGISIVYGLDAQQAQSNKYRNMYGSSALEGLKALYNTPGTIIPYRSLANAAAPMFLGTCAYCRSHMTKSVVNCPNCGATEFV